MFPGGTDTKRPPCFSREGERVRDGEVPVYLDGAFPALFLKVSAPRLESIPGVGPHRHAHPGACGKAYLVGKARAMPYHSVPSRKAGLQRLPDSAEGAENPEVRQGRDYLGHLALVSEGSYTSAMRPIEALI